MLSVALTAQKEASGQTCGDCRLALTPRLTPCLTGQLSRQLASALELTGCPLAARASSFAGAWLRVQAVSCTGIPMRAHAPACFAGKRFALQQRPDVEVARLWGELHHAAVAKLRQGGWSEGGDSWGGAGQQGAGSVGGDPGGQHGLGLTKVGPEGGGWGALVGRGEAGVWVGGGQGGTAGGEGAWGAAGGASAGADPDVVARLAWGFALVGSAAKRSHTNSSCAGRPLRCWPQPRGSRSLTPAMPACQPLVHLGRHVELTVALTVVLTPSWS